MKRLAALVVLVLAFSGVPAAHGEVDTTPPTVTIDVPDGTVVAASAITRQSIVGTISDTESGASAYLGFSWEPVIVRAGEVSTGGGLYIRETKVPTCADAGRTSCTWSTTGPYGFVGGINPLPGAYHLYVTGWDAAGNSTRVGPRLVVITR